MYNIIIIGAGVTGLTATIAIDHDVASWAI